MKTYLETTKKLFCSTLCIALLAVLLAACSTTGTGGQATGGGSTSPTAQASSVTIPSGTPLTSIRMLDQENGWALTRNAVLRTKDGGLHWQSVLTLPAISAAFRDMNDAWVTFHEASAAQGAFTMMRTTDGGASWQTATIQEPAGISYNGDGIDRPHFVNTQEGWVTTGQAEGMHHSSMNIFHTTDGGLHWTMIATTAAQSQSGLTDGGDKTGISFKDSQAGWVTAEVPARDAWLYRTNDGGRTWQPQTLPPPKQFSNAELIGDFTTTPPVFFGNDGILPTTIYYQSQSYIVFYVTHDGGKTWTPTTPFTSGVAGISNIYVADMQHAWFSVDNTFYSTSDGGQSWAKVGQTPVLISEVSFVDANNGWAIGLPNNESPLLLHTTDGGRTWQAIAYSIQ